MKEFLRYVAEDIIRKYGTNLSRTAVVFPNKRASLFLNEQLARIAQRPIWSPAYITISELFRQQSNLQVADPIKLVCDLHKSFCQETGSDETLDKFYGWGQLLISDFDDIDKNMVDANRVFANLRDIHELDDLSFLTEEQRQLLRHFFSHFTEEHETELKQRLQKEGKAKFYWDFDQYYMQHHEAGRYIAQYLQYFPNELDNTDEEIYQNFHHPKDIRYIAAPTEHVQARYVSSWLRQHERYQDGRRTAIVLCDESLLPTVIHCLPNETEKVNITTGYPLAQTPIASFIQLYYNLQLGGRSPRLLRAFKRHPYARFVDLEQAISSSTPLTSNLSSMLRTIAQNAKDEIQDPLFQESLFRAYTLVNRLNGLIESGDLQVTEQTLQRLTTQIIQQASIPFHGEPAEGIQVMGVLETRNLDFDHVLLLSCNEGNMPKGVNDSSFIPHSIRQAYELTTVENKVSIYAYYFHRLLQRASDVTILYNNSTEDGQRGEMSRFMLQMLVESGHPITQHTLQAGKQAERWTPKPIEKTEHVMSILTSQGSNLKSQSITLSPTAISKYMRCPLQFYYRYVAGLQEPDVPDDEQELDNRMFGDIFHDAADIIYHRLPQHITKDILDHLLNTKVEIERAVDEAFHNKMPNSPLSGLHIINREVIIHYLRQLIMIDRRLTPFTILGLECDVYRQLSTVNGQLSTFRIGGRIDRLDLVDEGTPLERIRVVDYKTSSRNIKSMPNVDAIFAPEQIHNHSDYYLQAFLYADIVRKQRGKAVSPALLFIQHAGAEDYDPNELLNKKVDEIFSSTTPFCPTDDLKICRTCPYAQLCRR